MTSPTKIKCVEETTDPLISLGEKKSKALFLNTGRHNFRKIRVDDCLVKEGPRADWIITKIGVGSIILELKGRGVAQACKQIEATRDHPICKPWLEKDVAYLIVSTKVPSADTSIQRALVEARKRNSRLHVKNLFGRFSVEELLGREILQAEDATSLPPKKGGREHKG